MLYYRKGVAAHKVVYLLKLTIISLPDSAKYKVGLFIFAYCSYQYRKATQRETNHQKTTGLKLRMYSYASPPFFSEVREATTLQHGYSIYRL